MRHEHFADEQRLARAALVATEKRLVDAPERIAGEHVYLHTLRLDPLARAHPRFALDRGQALLHQPHGHSDSRPLEQRTHASPSIVTTRKLVQDARGLLASASACRRAVSGATGRAALALPVAPVAQRAWANAHDPCEHAELTAPEQMARQKPPHGHPHACSPLAGLAFSLPSSAPPSSPTASRWAWGCSSEAGSAPADRRSAAPDRRCASSVSSDRPRAVPSSPPGGVGVDEADGGAR